MSELTSVSANMSTGQCTEHWWEGMGQEQFLLSLLIMGNNQEQSKCPSKGNEVNNNTCTRLH